MNIDDLDVHTSKTHINELVIEILRFITIEGHPIYNIKPRFMKTSLYDEVVKI